MGSLLLDRLLRNLSAPGPIHLCDEAWGLKTSPPQRTCSRSTFGDNSEGCL